MLPFNETLIFNNTTENYTLKEFLFDTLNNSFYLKFQMGTPWKDIISKFSINNSDLSIKYTNDEKFIKDYDPLKSSSFINITEKDIENKKQGFSFITENLKLIGLNKTYIVNNFKLFKENKNIDNSPIYLYAELGLNFYSKSQYNNESYIFLNQLKSNNIIENKIFSINYNDNKIGGGNIYIGDYPHNIKDSLSYYKNHKLFSYNSSSTIIDSLYLAINDKYQIENNIKVKNVYFNISSPVIFASSEFINRVDELFFNKYIKSKICSSQSFRFNDKLYFLYSCIQERGDFKLKLDEFPDLNFYSKDLNYTFTLTYEDLFIKINDIYYFLIIYDFYSGETWKFGRPFLQKYKFVFNCENYSLSFYDINEKENKNDEDEEKEEEEDDKEDGKTKRTDSNIYNVNLIILLIILIAIFNVLLLFLVIKFIKYRKKTRNKRVCELNNDEDDIDYFNDDQKNINSS